MATKEATFMNHVAAHPSGLGALGEQSGTREDDTRKGGIRFPRFRALSEAWAGMSHLPEHLYPIAFGILAAGLLFLTGNLASEAGDRLLAAIIGTSGLVYVWLAFDRSGYGRTLVNLASAAAVYVAALKGMNGNTTWLLAGIWIHALRGALPFTSSLERSRGLHIKEGWVAFNVTLAMALILAAM